MNFGFGSGVVHRTSNIVEIPNKQHLTITFPITLHLKVPTYL